MLYGARIVPSSHGGKRHLSRVVGRVGGLEAVENPRMLVSTPFI